MRLLFTSLLSTILLVGCSNNIRNQHDLKDKISEAFGTQDVEVFQGMSTGDHGTYPFIEISLAGVPQLDSDTLYDVSYIT